MVAFQSLLASFSATIVVSALPNELSQRPPTDRELSAPGTIVKRATGSRADPHILNINCADGADLCETNCNSILCRLAPNPNQYGGGISSKNREISGYSSSLLRTSNANRVSHGADFSDNVLDQVGRSMEESVGAAAIQGGVGEILYAADPKQNMLIGARIGGQLKKEKVKKEQWYFRWYTNWKSYPGKKYCPALQCDCDYDYQYCPPCTPDHSVCAETNDSLDPANRALMASNVDQNNAANNMYHKLGPDDLYTGHYWGNSKKERDLVSRDDFQYAEQYSSGGPDANVPESEKKITPPDDSDAGEFTLPE